MNDQRAVIEPASHVSFQMKGASSNLSRHINPTLKLDRTKRLEVALKGLYIMPFPISSRQTIHVCIQVTLE